MADESGTDLKKELNQLWRSTVGQLDEIKDVIVKSSHAGKARIDAAMLERERANRLQELGELVLSEGEEAAYPPAWKEKIQEIKDLDEQISSQKEEFDSLVKDVKEAVPDLSGSPAATPKEPEADASSEPDEAEDEAGADKDAD